MTDPSRNPRAQDVVSGTPPFTVELAYRRLKDTPPPERIRMEVPGWAGSSTSSGEGAPAQPWHCRPYMEAATYGLQLIYPYDAECQVRNEGGVPTFHGPLIEQRRAAGKVSPFGTLTGGHYGMAARLDLLPPEGCALRLEPHPRFFTDRTGEVPLVVPGHLRRFWPHSFFVVFRAPSPGGVHVFRPGDAYAQVLVVPEEATYRAVPMDEVLASDRAHQEWQSKAFGFLIARRLRRSDTGRWFNDAYKQLLRIFRRSGMDGVRRHLQATEDRATPKPRG